MAELEHWTIRSAVTVTLDGTETMASEIIGPAPPPGEDLQLVRADAHQAIQERAEKAEVEVERLRADLTAIRREALL